MKIKKIISVIISAAMCFSLFAVNVSADEKGIDIFVDNEAVSGVFVGDKSEYDYPITTIAEDDYIIWGDITIKDATIEDVPNGVTPVEMSLAEYEQYTHEMENLAHTKMRFDENPTICTPYKYVSGYSDTYTTQKDLLKIGIEITSMKLTTMYTYDRDDTYGPINFPRNMLTGANATVTLAGYTLGFSLSDVETLCTISSDKQRCTTVAAGSLQQYLLIDGLIKIQDIPFSAGHSFSVLAY